mmetsp:Transcript_10544/g.19058  ORF Transcript_10544/g.19058 Transcript_10544/m.19058 type:complete len:133 (-) Transcript_10544:745-1143(-)
MSHHLMPPLPPTPLPIPSLSTPLAMTKTFYLRELHSPNRGIIEDRSPPGDIQQKSTQANTIRDSFPSRSFLTPIARYSDALHKLLFSWTSISTTTANENNPLQSPVAWPDSSNTLAPPTRAVSKSPSAYQSY